MTRFTFFFFWASLKSPQIAGPANPLLTERDYSSLFSMSLSWWRKLLQAAQGKRDALYDTMGKTLGQLPGWCGAAGDRTRLAVN